jgi:hypothetical protein
MKRGLAFLLGIVLIAGAGAAFAGGRGGRAHAHASVVAPGFAHPRPFFHHHRGTVVVGSAIFVGGVGYPYYPYYYYPYYYPYAAPAYVEEPPVTYIEQSDQLRYYCPDSRAYYPEVTTCPSPWMKVVP